MYREICDFANLKGLSVQQNRKTSAIHCYVVLASDGTYQGLDVPDKKLKLTKVIPDVGSYAATAYHANAIVEKCVNIFSDNVKHRAYMETMKTGIDDCVSLSAIYAFLQTYDSDEDLHDRVQDDLNYHGLKDSSVISFRVDGQSVEDMESDWNDWLVAVVSDFKSGVSQPVIVSSYSGKLQESCPASAGPCIKNVPGQERSVFGLGRPCYFVAAKYNAYESYGFEGGLGFQLGQQDANLFAAGIEFLLSNSEYHSNQFGLIYFYDKEVENILNESLDFNIDEADLESLESDVDEHKGLLTQILQAAFSGKQPLLCSDDSSYYMAKFTADGGRYYLSNDRHASYNELIEYLYHWYRDTMIFTGYKNSTITKFNRVLFKCVTKPGLTDKDLFAAAEKEFGSVKMYLLDAVYQGHQIPKQFYDKALRRVSIGVASSNPESDEKQSFDMTVYVQIIKCYLIRKGYSIMPELTMNQGAAYNCGRLFAVYEQLQWLYNHSAGEQFKRLNRTVAQTYMSMAMKQPGIAFTQLAPLGVVYFSKLSDSSAGYFTKLMGEISDKIGTGFPVRFSDDEKGSFVLGYYQQRADFRKSRTVSQSESDEFNKKDVE